MGKYANAISYWEHNLAGIEHKLKPTEEDNLEFLRLKKKAEKADDETILFKGIGNLYFKKWTTAEEIEKLKNQQVKKNVN